MKRTIINFLWIAALIVAVYVFIDQQVITKFVSHDPTLTAVEKKPDIAEITKDIIPPPPLHASSTVAVRRTLATGSQIVSLTNQERQKEGLPALGENTMLDKAAEVKVRDMFTRQYFEHVAPTGEDVSFRVKQEGYDFLIIGENLAMGGFKNDQAIVDAWMASPGHRENILNPKYREIGVATASGIFNGGNVLLAVQVFGTPSTVCPKPDAVLKSQIDTQTVLIDEDQKKLDALQQDIDHAPSSSARRALVEQYNSLVVEFNAMIAEVKIEINDYNAQIDRVNACIQGAQ